MNKSDKISSRGVVCIAALALFGETALVINYSSNLGSDLVGFTAALLFVGAGFFVLPLIKKLLQKTPLCKNFFFKGAFFILSALVCLLVCVISLLSFSRFADIFMRPPLGLVFVFVGLTVFCVFAATQKIALFRKLAIILLPVICVFLVFIFAFSVGFMDIKYLIPHKALDFSSAGKSFSGIALVCLPTLLPLSVTAGGLTRRQKVAAFGLFSGLIILCFASPLALFGSELASTLSHPYAAAVGTAAIGNVFSRLDPLFYSAAFFSCFFKAAVSLKAFLIFLEKFFCEILNFTIEKYDKLW